MYNFFCLSGVITRSYLLSLVEQLWTTIFFFTRIFFDIKVGMMVVTSRG